MGIPAVLSGICPFCSFRSRGLTRSSPFAQDDEKFLQDSTLPPRKRMAIIVRLGEKRILRATRLQLESEFPAGSSAPPQEAKKDKKRSRDERKEGPEEGKKAKVRK